jgi:hypothetical protein
MSTVLLESLEVRPTVKPAVGTADFVLHSFTACLRSSRGLDVNFLFSVKPMSCMLPLSFIYTFSIQPRNSVRIFVCPKALPLLL